MKNTRSFIGIALLLMLLFAGCTTKPAGEPTKETTTSLAAPQTTTSIIASTTTTASTTSSTTTSTTLALPKEKCWDGANKYLFFDIPQMRKFCKCASGKFAYKTYSRAGNYAQAYSYIDYRDTDNWNVRRTPSAYSPIYYVICGDNRTYWANQTYYR